MGVAVAVGLDVVVGTWLVVEVAVVVLMAGVATASATARVTLFFIVITSASAKKALIFRPPKPVELTVPSWVVVLMATSMAIGRVVVEVNRFRGAVRRLAGWTVVLMATSMAIGRVVVATILFGELESGF
jgi:hypothetical protein